MQATPLRVRLAPAFEWVVAAAFLLATLGVALLLLHELRTAPAASPPVQAPAFDGAGQAPSAVPEHAVSVPALMLMDGAQVRVGDTAEQIGRVLGSTDEVGVAATEQGPLGPRVIRTYQRRGTRFLLVLEPFERNGKPRVAGIYLQ